MNLTDVIEGLVDERGLDKENVIAAVCEGVLAAFQKKFPTANLKVVFNKKIGEIEAFVDKTVVVSTEDDETQISLRRAKVLNPNVKVGEVVEVPFEHKIGRIEILTAKQIIANKIRALEQSSVYADFKDKQGSIISGTVYKRERAGYAIKMGEITALLPNENLIPMENLRAGLPIRALLKEVLEVAHGDYQLILDRASAAFVKKLLEIEIPEVFEGVVEVKKIVRIPGYKTKAIVISNSKDIDPVGTCVGVGGSRIKPILKELGQEKIDLIQWVDSSEALVKLSLKPAEIDKVSIDGDKVTVWLAQDQRSLAIGKMGQNINLASRLVGMEIQLQDVTTGDSVVRD
ncbi:MAG: NusA antitermination factor [candidate division TM6 bacterium GW2011_GWF2_28_16]|nr:MAG: NusA antitermination factor [candidate division TM6 bacterium GW2011_GWF2_28_16]